MPESLIYSGGYFLTFVLARGLDGEGLVRISTPTHNDILIKPSYALSSHRTPQKFNLEIINDRGRVFRSPRHLSRLFSQLRKYTGPPFLVDGAATFAPCSYESRHLVLNSSHLIV